jgi:hypothetical protein
VADNHSIQHPILCLGQEAKAKLMSAISSQAAMMNAQIGNLSEFVDRFIQLLQNAKVSTTPGVPRQSPIQVLFRPDSA